MEKYILLPCTGRKWLNIPSRHVYQVKSEGERKEIGWITEETAKKKYGEGNYIISESSSMCPLCFLDWLGQSKFNLITDE